MANSPPPSLVATCEGHDKPRLMGVASHRSFPGDRCISLEFLLIVGKGLTSWWLQIFLMFTLLFGEDFHFDYLFQMG